MGYTVLHNLELTIHKYVILFHMQVMCVRVCFSTKVASWLQINFLFFTSKYVASWTVAYIGGQQKFTSSSISVGDQRKKLLLKWSVQYKTTDKLLHSAIRICRRLALMAISCSYLSSGQHFNVTPVRPITQ